MESSNNVREVYGFIAALRTLLDDYPELQTDDRLLTLMNSNDPISFIVNIVEILGISKEDILDWVCKMLCGDTYTSSNDEDDNNEEEEEEPYTTDTRKVDNGILSAIEVAVKALLIVNCKNTLSCSFNPVIPQEMIKYPVPNPEDSTFISGKGLVIPISTIDAFNVLQNHPNSKIGRGLYFDNKMNSNDYWQSMDFNTFLWYIINKSSNINNEGLKKIWDNRVLRREELLRNSVFRTNFFQLFKGDKTYIDTRRLAPELSSFERNKKNTTAKEDKENKILKKQFLIAEYNEVDPTTSTPNTITIWVNGDRYRKKIGGMYFSSTAFEFNYDYVTSLKLFESKTLVANIVNGVLGITRGLGESILDGKYSIEQQITAATIGNIVNEVMNNGDTIINDCFFSFSNEKYETLVQEAENKYNNNYQFGEVTGEINEESYDEISKSIDDIENSATLVEQQNKIKNIFTGVGDGTTSASNGVVELKDSFTFGQNILTDIIKESITQLILQVLSPKVMLLYVVNSYFMGDSLDKSKNPIDLIKGMGNLIKSMVVQILKIIIDELLKEIIAIVKSLLNGLLRIILNERLQFYMEIIKRLAALVEMFYNAFNTNKGNSFIDNVNYAEIEKETNITQLNKC